MESAFQSLVQFSATTIMLLLKIRMMTQQAWGIFTMSPKAVQGQVAGNRTSSRNDYAVSLFEARLLEGCKLLSDRAQAVNSSSVLEVQLPRKA